MTDMYSIKKKYLTRLNDKILSNYKYVQKLNACNNPKITNVNHMTNLKVLNASVNCGIDDKGIKEVDLEILCAYSNSKITNVNHMSNLKELDASVNCGIDDSNR